MAKVVKQTKHEAGIERKKTLLSIDPRVWATFKATAATKRVPVYRLVERALREFLRRES